MNIVVALLVAVCVSVLSATGLAFPCGGLNSVIAGVALGLGTIAGGIAYHYCAKNRPVRLAKPPGVWELGAIAVYTLFSLRAFCWLIYRDEGELRFLSDNNLGDLSLHLTYINNLANGVPFWPDSPIFAGDKTRYPLGMDLFNSLLDLMGMDICHGLVCVGLIGSLITGAALWRWGRGFALAGFLFNGGLAGFEILRKLHLADYQAAVAWKSIPLAMLVTQRGLLYAIPAGLMLLWSWRTRYFSNREEDAEKPLPFWIELLLYSTMPLFHLHTFIFLSLLLGCWFAMTAFTGDLKTGFSIIKLVACALIPATLLTGLITDFFKSGSVIHLVSANSSSWDWDYNEQPQFAAWAQQAGLPSFFGHVAGWLVNYGAFPILVAALVWKLRRAIREPALFRAAAFVFPAVLIFIFACVVMLAPWDWDNNKLMIWSYFALLPFLWEQLVAKWPRVARDAICFVLFFSGFVSLIGGLDNRHTGYDLADCGTLDEVADATRTIPATAVFAGTPTYNHPLLLNGRNMVMGYAGHLMSQGVKYEPQEQLLTSLLNGDDDWRKTAAQIHAQYIFWSVREEEDYPHSKKPWEEECRKVAEGSWGKIYEIGAAPLSRDAP